jgi:DNA-binding LytR/AlgR family response regulator
MLIKTIQRSRRANIHIERILYVESMGNQTTFHMVDGMQIVCHMTLTLAHEMFPALDRISSSFLLNEKEIRCIDSIEAHYYFKLSNGEKIKISKSNPIVKEFLDKNDR